MIIEERKVIFMPWLFFLILSTLLSRGEGLRVTIAYSFRVPEEFGVASPKIAGCCPFVTLPDNKTQGMVPPTVFGIGVQKGGTTTLHERFKAHSNLIPPRSSKELHYLDDARSLSFQTYLRRWNTNRAGSEKGLKKSKLFEISPSYLYVPFSACRANVISPNAKFVVFLRDPTERAHSGLGYSSSVMSRRYGNGYAWMHLSFLQQVELGLGKLQEQPKCNFQTGAGLHTYNDCLGCMLRWVKVQSKCGQRPFVTLTNNSTGYECNFVGKEHILRGMYAAQLSWWFTLFQPSQFIIINSEDFFKDQLGVLKQIGSFLELKPTYTSDMYRHGRGKANVQHYKKEAESMLAKAKGILKEFYRRPNLELYRLLHENGHQHFTPFDPDLRKRESLNCDEEATIKSGICGDPRFLKPNKRQQTNSTDVFPAKVQNALHLFTAEKPDTDAEETMQEIEEERDDDVSEKDEERDDDVSEKDEEKDDDVSEKNEERDDDVSEKDEERDDDVSEKDEEKDDDVSEKGMVFDVTEHDEVGTFKSNEMTQTANWARGKPEEVTLETSIVLEHQPTAEHEDKKESTSNTDPKTVETNPPPETASNSSVQSPPETQKVTNETKAVSPAPGPEVSAEENISVVDKPLETPEGGNKTKAATDSKNSEELAFKLRDGSIEQRTARYGMSLNNTFGYILFASVFTGFFIYAYRCSKWSRHRSRN